MAFSLSLAKVLANVGWKVKIQDRESREDPHVTIWFKRQRWRMNLRTGKLMDGSSWKEINKDVKKIIEKNWKRLREEWDRRYGEVNPISGQKDNE